MTTQEAILTTKDVANRFSQLAESNQWKEILNELFSPDAVSIEPAGAQGMQNAEGLPAIRKKGEMWEAMVQEVHGGWCSKPVVGGKYFSVAMGMDANMKGGERSQMDEIALYEVRNGKIVKEQFFY